jgi:hypothetical protein
LIGVKQYAIDAVKQPGWRLSSKHVSLEGGAAITSIAASLDKYQGYPV